MAEERVQRRLTAILAGDVVGDGRLMGADEAGTRARFDSHLRALSSPLWPATTVAVSIQRCMAIRNAACKRGPSSRP